MPSACCGNAHRSSMQGRKPYRPGGTLSHRDAQRQRAAADFPWGFPIEPILARYERDRVRDNRFQTIGGAPDDPASPAELATCKTLLTNTLNFTIGLSPTLEKIIQQRQIAEILYNFYFQDDYETAVLMESNRKITATGLGIGLTMNEWIPIMRTIMTAIAIGVTPFLVLFLPTPVAPNQ